MEWTEKGNGKHHKIQGIHTYPPQIDSSHRMDANFHRGDIEWAVEMCFLEAGSKDSSVHPYVKSILD